MINVSDLPGVWLAITQLADGYILDKKFFATRNEALQELKKMQNKYNENLTYYVMFTLNHSFKEFNVEKD